MRKFRFVGNHDDYSGLSLQYDQIVGENYYSKGFTYPIGGLVKRSPEDWEEVFDNPKPLHKDTDLGYFAGLAMQALVSNNFSPTGYQNGSREDLMIEAYRVAKELIKQLNEEGK